jgi:hypothetical protein
MPYKNTHLSLKPDSFAAAIDSPYYFYLQAAL